jgi:ribonuclease P protein component
MLSQAHRLKKKKDFDRIFKRGKGLREGFLFVKAVQNGLAESRFGFVVGQNVSKKASARNYLKRKLRALIRERLPKISRGLDIVIVAPGAVSKENMAILEKTIDNIFKKAKLFI